MGGVERRLGSQKVEGFLNKYQSGGGGAAVEVGYGFEDGKNQNPAFAPKGGQGNCQVREEQGGEGAFLKKE